MNTYTLKKIDPVAFTNDDWKEYYDFRIKSEAVGDKMNFVNWESLKKITSEVIKTDGYGFICCIKMENLMVTSVLKHF